MRKDHDGWIEANEGLKKRERSDPWYALHERCREVYQLGGMVALESLTLLVQNVNGPPTGVTVDSKRGDVVRTYVYDISINKERAVSSLEQIIIGEQVKRGRAMMAERKNNQEKK